MPTFRTTDDVTLAYTDEGEGRPVVLVHGYTAPAASWVLTGETASDTSAGVRPRNNFDFGNGHWGAFQVSARYHTLEVDEKAIALGLAAAGSSHKAEAWTVGLRWYLNPNVW